MFRKPVLYVIYSESVLYELSFVSLAGVTLNVLQASVK